MPNFHENNTNRHKQLMSDDSVWANYLRIPLWLMPTREGENSHEHDQFTAAMAPEEMVMPHALFFPCLTLSFPVDSINFTFHELF